MFSVGASRRTGGHHGSSPAGSGGARMPLPDGVDEASNEGDELDRYIEQVGRFIPRDNPRIGDEERPPLGQGEPGMD